ncbi:MAG: DUF1553 domain-containing protein [Planctomycetes bacterium]|nr:DUF1553 domain-containing protein [Planctomycetota bacterium]
MIKPHVPCLLVLLAGAGVAAREVPAAGAPAGQSPAPATPGADDAALAAHFEARVRPILAARCDECHGETGDGGLRLDSREGLEAGGDSGPAVIVGDPDGSLLMQAVRHTHKSLQMPKRRGKLPNEELEILARWIADGAYWPKSQAPQAAGARTMDVASQLDFWSLQPLTRPALPGVRDGQWPKGDIDRFVLARLEHEGLAPVGPADKPTLLRRASFDLTGLPPSPEEVAAFVADDGPDAFAKVVDRLLASPRYGEAWGRWWLDVARYGEDDCRSLDPMGRGLNPYPFAYLYRDWVVQALNDDLPYDQFTEQQLAADLVDDDRRAARLPALGFLGLGPWLYDNGMVEVTRADERHDRVDALSRGFLGLTISCARCHDHKYDAISTEDYYGIAGVFKNTVYREYPLVPRSIVEEYEKKKKRLDDQQKLLGEHERRESQQLAETLAFQTSKYMLAAWRIQGPKQEERGNVASEEELDYEVLDRWLAFLAKPPRNYPYLVKWQALIAERGPRGEAVKLASEFQELVLDVLFEQRDAEAENEVIRAKALPTTKPKKDANLPHEFVTNDDFCPGCGLELKQLKGERNALWNDLFDHDLDQPLDFAQNLKGTYRPGVFSFSGFGLERQMGAERRARLATVRAAVKKLKQELEPKFPYVHGVADAEQPTPIQVHVRGSPFRLGAKVPPRLPPLLTRGATLNFNSGSGRLELARAVAAHPISARVIVNRVWKWHFGTGIVETPGDFGRTGERPSHPELLEHLAWTFVEGGRSLKQLHRSILLSATYQLAAADSEKNAAVDSGNRLYWRANARRLSAEQLRDAALTAAGTLDLKQGGPSEKLTPFSTRRTLYAHISRYRLDEYLALFDFPSPNSTAERRFATQVPLQRLFLMNSEFLQQQAELLARRVADEPDDQARIVKLYRLLFARAPSESELAAGRAYLSAEPLRSWGERKAAKEEEAKAKDAPGAMKSAPKSAAPQPDDAPESPDGGPPDAREDGQDQAPGGAEAGNMMSGVAGAGAAGKPAPKALPVTVLGRYAKVLLSSNEFLFVR